MSAEESLGKLRIEDWGLLDHCGARNLLEREGWRFVAAGDWAVVLADPAGLLAARISAFELAYQHFVSLCERMAGNRWLPAIHRAVDLEGGGHLTVMELLTPRQVPDDDSADPVWSLTDDADLGALRREVERVDLANRQQVAWWGGVEVKGEHFMTAEDGQLKLVDPFYVAGAVLFGAVLEDYAQFCSVLPPSRHRYMLQIPHFSEAYASDQLRALRAATAVPV